MGLFSQETLIKTLLQQKKPSFKQGLPVNKKTLFAFVSALLLSVAAGKFALVAEANPYMFGGYLPAGSETTPPKISIHSPKNSSIYKVNNVTLAFNVTQPTGPTVSSPKINQIYYSADWLEKNVIVYDYVPYLYYPYSGRDADGRYSNISIEKNLNEIPDGHHNITVIAWYEWTHITGFHWVVLFMNGSFSVNVVIDTACPKVSILSTENNTFNTPFFPLNFVVNEPFSKISYVSDNQENVTIGGNTTLIGLSYGVHNVTVYAWDEADNAGTSETVCFTITEPEPPEPFPTTMVITPAASAVSLGVGLAVYFRKHKR